MKTFRTLELATEFYRRSQKLKIKGHLREQLQRGSSSVALNLAEGNAKFSVDEKKRFYQIAYASLKECRTILELLEVKDDATVRLADQLGAHLYKLIDSKLTSVRKPAQ